MSTKRKAPGKLAPPTVKPSAKLPTKSAIDESRTSVAGTDVFPPSQTQPEAIDLTQTETIELSSGSDSDEDLSDSDEDADKPQANGDSNVSSHVNGKPSPNHAEQQDEDGESDGEAGAPSFGELLRSNEAIDVPNILQQSSASGTVAQPNRSHLAPPPASLTTVLTQALRTDDTDLLESCLHSTDTVTIRNTIENIDSTLAGTLLTKLASRLYRRPGRAGSLMTWVQWTLIAHGGALASQPKVINSLSGLQKVLVERAKGLNSLLALKGKLDLLDDQMKLRKQMQKETKRISQGDEEEDEDAVWVEGETDDVGQNDEVASRRKRLIEDDDGEPVMNGAMGDSSDEEDSLEEEEEEEEDRDDGEESLDEDEVDHDDVDESMGEEEDSDVETAPPSKVQKVSKSFSKRK